MPKSVYDLDVYQRSYSLAIEIHKATLTFPKIEQYALAGQMRRASKSICANLAEGFAKSYKSPAEFRRLINIALGSAEEMQVWLDFSNDLSYVDTETKNQWKAEYVIVCKQLNKLDGSI